MNHSWGVWEYTVVLYCTERAAYCTYCTVWYSMFVCYTLSLYSQGVSNNSFKEINTHMQNKQHFVTHEGKWGGGGPNPMQAQQTSSHNVLLIPKMTSPPYSLLPLGYSRKEHPTVKTNRLDILWTVNERMSEAIYHQ